ncbi:MAG: proline dehydrogenase family protein, partial [Polaromonas sp.]
HKHHTDVSYLACAQALLAAPDAIYPQFATHNAGTIAAILQMAESAPTLAASRAARGLAGRGSPDASPLSPVQACSSTLGAAGSSPSGAVSLGGGPSEKRALAPQFELQRLHGMGEGVYREVLKNPLISCRVYAPVGAHRDLLAYL